MRTSVRGFDLRKAVSMKNSFVLVIFMHLAIEGYAFKDRQWQADDARQNCTVKCKDECIQCIKPQKCNVGEIKCGETPPDDRLHPDCPPDELCVPTSCNCKFRYNIYITYYNLYRITFRLNMVNTHIFSLS